MTAFRKGGRGGGGRRLRRRNLLRGVGGVTLAGLAGAMAAGGRAHAAPGAAGAASATSPTPAGAPAAAPVHPATGAARPARREPPVLRSRRELAERGVPSGVDVAPTQLPLTGSGATYDMAQSLAWLDDAHFAVGRWDGSLSVFAFTAGEPFAGPLIEKAANSPSSEGVRMVVPLTARSFVTSNDDRSLSLWSAPAGDWSGLRLTGTFPHPAGLGVATGGRAVPLGDRRLLAVGHTSGHLSVWRHRTGPSRLEFLRSVDLRNPDPVNPWGLHDVHAVEVLTRAAGSARVITGSEDGYVCVVEVPSGRILGQTVFNPAARRGINDLNVRGDAVLVANCSVGPDDFNLWYYTVDRSTWRLVLRDRANLVADTRRPQVFNFNTVWGAYSGGPCWFASTEEGALWMGTADGAGLHVLGYQEVTSPLGSALGWRGDPGRLAMVAYDLYEFTTD
ncbi:hypothetical protein [Streptomyces zingiberis]|uniref:WD40 repeat domain-containing protein n=1 Tax=Streptomyces zingiberis TaxID=2053010 RepID=A0ABX1BZ11_9ACTN|nr:hypothetical protein [Streptomyces zingiberis]NJQ02910.1 hypothetical protein [Streptomyces zingiberis]